MKISKAERQELRSAVRTQFKVLRRDIEVRKAELRSELEERINKRFAADDQAWNDAMFTIDEAVREANRKANDVLRGLSLEGYDRAKEYLLIQFRGVTRPDPRMEMRRRGWSRIDAQVEAAYRELERQEANLLTALIVDALESDEARAFLSQIPTVAALVPSDRIMAITGPLEEK